MNSKAKDRVLAEVCEVIAASMGLHFPVERWNMLRHNLMMASVEFGFDHFDDFTQWLLSTSLTKEQIKILAAYLTISETYFWREEPIFEALTQHILPALTASKASGERKIKIWSAGCSTGEEAYSLAIAVHKAVPNLGDWQILIMGTDMNPKALEKANNGIYGKWSFRNCPKWLISNYFRPKGNESYEIVPFIKDMVKFSNLNLTEDNFPSVYNNTNNIDILFCRNVLMYFTEDWVNKIASNFFRSLNPNGWFVVSSCELSSQLYPQFRTIYYPGAIMYQKGNLSQMDPMNIPVSVIEPNISRSIPASVVIRPSPILPDPIQVAVQLAASDTSEVGVKAPTEVGNERADIPIYTNVNDIILNIRMLANDGEQLRALVLCNETIEKNKFDKVLYFLRASILQELDRDHEAIGSLKQVIYLDHDCIMGYFCLGNLYVQIGRQKIAKKYFNVALDLLKDKPDNEILPELEGLSVKYMREIIVSSIFNSSIQ